MRQIIEASLVLVFAILLTVVIMAVIFPRHALGGLNAAAESPRNQPAVFIHSTSERPGTGDCGTDQSFADRGQKIECPYLAALTAASKCPAAPERSDGLTCPYREQLERQLRDVERTRAAARGQHI
jgi:hypothetical protein